MLIDKYPAIADLERLAKKRIPFLAWEYLDSGTGKEEFLQRKMEEFCRITLLPKQMEGAVEPDTSTELFGTNYSTPFGIAPIGLSSLMWPIAENILPKQPPRVAFLTF